MKQFIQNRHGQKISVVYKPAGDELAFIVHGLSGYKEQPHIRTMSEVFAEQGISTVIYDAANSFGESDGQLEQANLTRHTQDLEDVIRWASQQEWYREPFYLAGHSLGGGAILQYTLQQPEKVKAIAPTASVLSYQTWIGAQQKYQPEGLAQWQRDGYRIKESASKPGAAGKISWNLMEDMKNYDFVAAGPQYHLPVLMIVGDKDIGTPPEHQKLLYDALPGPKEYHEIQGCEHTFTAPEHLAQLKRIFQDWIKSLSG